MDIRISYPEYNFLRKHGMKDSWHITSGFNGFDYIVGTIPFDNTNFLQLLSKLNKKGYVLLHEVKCHDIKIYIRDGFIEAYSMTINPQLSIDTFLQFLMETFRDWNQNERYEWNKGNFPRFEPEG